jgi:hypothetical protein
MRKTKLSFDLFAQQHGNDGLFARFYRHPGSAILLQKQVSKASIAKIVGGTPPRDIVKCCVSETGASLLK